MNFRILPLLILLAGCAAGAESAPPEAQVKAPGVGTRVEVAEIRPSEATLTLTLPGEIQGARDAVLAAALGGYVERVYVRLGDSVKRGQVLALVDASIHQASLDQARAQATLARSEAERVDKLGDLASPQMRDQAHAQADIAAAGAKAAEARVARARITAPFDGVVAQWGAEEGEVASPSAPIGRLVQLDTVKVTLSVADRDVVALRKGMPARVRTPAAASWAEGTISHIGAAASLNTRTFEVEVEVVNPEGHLLPGMIAQVDVTSAVAEGALVLPQDWIVTRLQGPGVFVERDGHAAWRTVVLGDVVRDQVVVREGLTEGDRVVMVGHRELVEGDELLVSRVGTCCSAGRVTYGEAL